MVWDAAGVIVAENATLEIDTCTIREHRELDYATRKVPCVIDLDADCPTWIAFLQSALDPDVILCVQEWFGSALVRRKTRETTKALLIYGPSRSGKTQIANVLRALLGGKTCGIRVRDIEGPFGLQPFLDCAGWIADDAVSSHEDMDPEAFKLIVTGEPVSVARKNRTSIETAFDFPVCLTSNGLPKIRDDSDAVYNRSLMLSMKRVHSEAEAAPRPISEAVVDGELAGVLNWALAGWNRLKERGRFDVPESMQKDVQAFRSDNSPLSTWMKECLEPDDSSKVDRRDLYVCYTFWMKREFGPSARPLGQRALFRPIRIAIDGCEDLPSNGQRFMGGIKLTDEGAKIFENAVREPSFDMSISANGPNQHWDRSTKPPRDPKKPIF